MNYIIYYLYNVYIMYEYVNNEKIYIYVFLYKL